MRKSLIVLIVGGLIVGNLGAPAMAKKKKKPAPVSVDQKFFLRSTGCSAPDVNFDYLSLTDADEATQCFYTSGGARYEVGQTTGDVCVPDPVTGAGQRCAFASRETATRYFDALDGVPIVLDTTKAITGSIWTSGGSCVTPLAPCSPAGLGFGQATIDMSVVGKIGEEEVLIGELSETYQIVPGTVHEVKIDMKIDPALAGKVFDTIELRTWQGGMAVGHHVVNTNADTSSFITVPSFVTKK